MRFHMINDDMRAAPPHVDMESIELCRKLRESIRKLARAERKQLLLEIRQREARMLALDYQEDELCDEEDAEFRLIHPHSLRLVKA